MRDEVFVGRVRELRVVATALAGKPGSALVVGGSPGVGKSSTIRTALRQNRSTIGSSYWVGATKAAASIPFGAVAHLIGPTVGRMDHHQVLRSTADRLASTQSGGKTVVVVDDAHLLDRASAALVHFLSEVGAAVVITTLRTGEPVSDAVTALLKEDRGEYLFLEPLNRVEVGALVAGLLHGPVDPVSDARIWNVVEGNPLYARELVRESLASGDLVLRDGYWRWSGSPPVMPRLAQLITRRIESQPRRIRRLMDLLAYAGPLESDLLERCGCPCSLLAIAERRGMIRSVESVAKESGARVTIELGHPLFAESARAGKSHLHRRALAQILVKATDARAEQDPLRRAVWQLDGGGAVDGHLLACGADRALAALDLPLANRLAAAAVAAGAGSKAEVLLARVLVLRGGAAQAEELLAKLLDEPLEPEPWAQLTAQRAWNMVFGLEQPVRSEKILVDALSRARPGAQVLLVEQASIMTYAGAPTQALAALQAPLQSPDIDDSTLAQAYTVSAEARTVAGDVTTAIIHGRRATENYRKILGSDWSMARDEAESALVGALLMDGELDEAQSRIERSYDQSRDAGWAMGTGTWSLWRAEVALARGMILQAEEHYRLALAAYDRDPHPFFNWQKRFATDHLAAVLAMSGKVQACTILLDRADELARPWLGALDAWNGSTHAWLAAAVGDSATAIGHILDLADQAASRGQLGWATVTLHQAVRLGEASCVVGRVEELSTKTSGRVARLYLEHATSLSRHDGTHVLGVATRFGGLGMKLLAAEAAAQAHTCLLEAGDARGAAIAQQCSLRWAQECVGAATPALRQCADTSELTAREVQIAHIAAAGTTNRDIADQLGISPRTVENILHHVYEKTHLQGRGDLPAFLGYSRDAGVNSNHR